MHKPGVSENPRPSDGEYVKKAGLPHVRIHDLRHTFASWLVQNGVPLKTVQELFDHKDIKTTMGYAHLSPEHLRDAINQR